MDGTSTVATGPERYQYIEVIPFAGSMGAEIQGVDLANLDDATFDELYAAWLRHHVVVTPPRCCYARSKNHAGSTDRLCAPFR